MAAGEASVQGSTGSLLQAEGRTCEDFQDEDSFSSSPDSSFSPFDGDLTTTSSSVFVDSLTTEGKSGAEPPPWSITVPDGDYLRGGLLHPFTPEAPRVGALAGERQKPGLERVDSTPMSGLWDGIHCGEGKNYCPSTLPGILYNIAVHLNSDP